MAYKTDRNYTNLIYSSADLIDGNYTLYKDGEISGSETNGLYTEVTNYSKGTQQGYSSTGSFGGMQGGMRGGMNGQLPNNGNMQNNGEMPNGQNGNIVQPNEMNSNSSATNKNFTISGISNQFRRVGDYTGTDDSTEGSLANSTEETTSENNTLDSLMKNQNIIITIAAIVTIILIGIIIVISNKKKIRK